MEPQTSIGTLPNLISVDGTRTRAPPPPTCSWDGERVRQITVAPPAQRHQLFLQLPQGLQSLPHAIDVLVEQRIHLSAGLVRAAANSRSSRISGSGMASDLRGQLPSSRDVGRRGTGGRQAGEAPGTGRACRPSPQHCPRAWIGGHFTDPNEQNTQQSPDFGCSGVLQLSHS